MEPPFAVVENGKLVDARNADVIVPWWSFTKTVIAAAALVLVGQKRLVLDQPLPSPPYTLRQLLQHRAGVANYAELAAYHEAVARGDEPWTVPVLLERIEADRLRYEPGHGWTYSNTGYLFVRELVEQVCGEHLDAILRRLVLHPLGIRKSRIAERRADLDGVAMGTSAYHPGWVYHGLLIGPLREAALLLDGLMTGDLLPPNLLNAMREAVQVGGPVPGRPWKVPGYGLGLMCALTANDVTATGHTGSGPGSMIAVYHLPDAPSPYTAAAFAFGDNVASVENAVLSRR
jgi:CubicO group peptidase (beta-lactamase class C family)